ncbi:hypothetical protein CRUP_002834 [Coryphaenoides rupestris]|nr:hypothetical protein CRUP_002834 [Coryphaenoides rupestris]
MQLRRLYEEMPPSRRMSSSPVDRSPRDESSTVDGGSKPYASPDDSDLEARLNSWNLGIFKSTLARDSTLLDEAGPVRIANKEHNEKHWSVALP